MTNEAPKQIGPNVTQQWLHDRRMVIFTVQETDRKSVDAWVDAILQIIEDYKGGTRPLFLYDVSSSYATFTPYMRKKFEEQVNQTTDETAYLAFVFTNNFLQRLVKMFMMRTVSRQQPTLVFQIFFERQQAIEWLEGFLDKIPKPEINKS